MTTDQLLIDLFAERSEERADASDVLAALHERLDAPRHVNATRLATVLGSAAAVAALAIGLSAVTSGGRGGSHHPQPVGAAAPGGLGTGSPAPSAAPSVAPSGGSSGPGMSRAPGARNYSTIAAGWLPGPVTHVDASNQPGFEERDYTVMVDGVEMDAIIYLEDGPLPGRTEAGGKYRSLTINGHPAREFVGDRATIIAVDLGNGKIAYAGPSVAATTSRVTTARITQIAEHMVSAMQFDRHDPIS